MLTLSYGFKKPETLDKGAILFTVLEGDIQQLNDHNHNGTNSSKLPASSVQGVSQTISSGSWSGTGATGNYRQQVTLPAGYDYDEVKIGFRNANGDYLYPTVERVSDTQFYVYTTDNTLTFTAIYGG